RVMLMMNRRDFLLGGAGLPVLAQRAGGRKPNILFLFSDDQRFSTLHALNNPDVRTPNMDKLIERGVTFTHACIMGGTIPAVCAPSRAMLMTGQTLFHVDESIVRPQAGRPGRPFLMFPELFRQSGYKTFGTGKWHNGPNLFARCFSE